MKLYSQKLVAALMLISACALAAFGSVQEDKNRQGSGEPSAPRAQAEDKPESESQDAEAAKPKSRKEAAREARREHRQRARQDTAPR